MASSPPLPPYSIVHQLLAGQSRAAAEQRERARRAADVHRGRYRMLAVEAANATHDLHGFLAAHGDAVRAAGMSPQAAVLAALARRLDRALRHAEVELVDPTGCPWPTVADHLAEVVHAPDTEDESRLVVARAVRPAVVLPGGELAQRSQVLLGEPSHERRRGDGPS